MCELTKLGDMNEKSILDRWSSNAKEWTRAVRDRQIPSRTAIADRVILELAGSGQERAALDLGCGEGWLTRALTGQGWRMTGVDGSGPLVDIARASSNETFLHLDYDRARTELSPCSFSLVIANFSLLGEVSVEAAFRATHSVLERQGRFVVQTVHPLVVGPPYSSGWRIEDWSGFESLRCEPSPWYFRTFADWYQLFALYGFKVSEILEPTIVSQALPTSLIFVASKN